MRLNNNFSILFCIALGFLTLLGFSTSTYGQICTADFAVSSYNNLTVSLTNTSTGGVPGSLPNAIWDFGDGVTATTYDATHTFTTAGTYNTCLTIFDASIGCQSVFCDDITVPVSNTACQYEISYTANGLDVVLELSPLTPNSILPNSIEWQWANPTFPVILGTGSPLSYTAPAAGTYDICVAYEISGTTCNGTLCETITVTDPITPPTCNIDFGYTITSDSIAIFEVINNTGSIPYSNVTWLISDNATTVTGGGSPFTYIFPSSGTYSVCVIGEQLDAAGNVVCSADSCEMLTINISPPTNCAYNIAYTTSGLDVVLELMSNTAATMPTVIDWFENTSGGGTIFGSGSPLTYTFPAAGTYDVCVDYGPTAFCSAGVLCETITVTDLTTPNCAIDFAYTLNDAIGIFEVVNNPATTPYSNVTWLISDAATTITGAGSPFTFIFPSSGTYNICVSGEQLDAAGNVICVADSCQSITVNIPTPTSCDYGISYTANGLDVALELQPLTATSVMPNIIEWQWVNPIIPVDLGSGSSVSFIAPLAGTYDICATYEVSGTTCNGTVCETITVTDPTPPNCAIDFVYTLSDSIGIFEVLNNIPGTTPFSNITWSFTSNNGTQTTGTGTPYTNIFPFSGSYEVCVYGEILDAIGAVVCTADSCEIIQVNFTPTPNSCAYAILTSVNDLTVAMDLGPSPDSQIPDVVEWYTSIAGTTIQLGTGMSATYTFPAAGTYDICADYGVSGTTCNSTECTTVTVTDPNTSNCDYAFNYTTNGLDVILDLSPTTPTTPLPNIIEWTWVDPLLPVLLGTGTPLSYTAPAAGTYNICVEYEVSGTTCNGTICEAITVTDPNTPTCTIDFTYNFINDSTAVFEAFGDPATGIIYDEIEWEVTGGSTGGSTTGTGSPFTYEFPASGNYYFCVIGTMLNADGTIACQADMCYVIPVNIPNPTPCVVDFTYSLNPNNVGVFDIIPSPALSIFYTNVEWIITGNGVTEIGIGTPYTYAFNAPGTYQVCVIADLVDMGGNYICTADECKTITVGSNVICDAFFEAAEISGTANPYQVEFANLSTGNYTDVFWTFGDGTTSTDMASSFVHDYTNVGVYQVCLTVWDNFGCQDNYCELVYVSGTPACDYEIATTVNLDIVSGTFIVNSGSTPSVIEWYEATTNVSLGSGSSFTYVFNNFGNYEICADYGIAGAVCSGTICETVTIVNPTCATTDCVFPGDADYDQVANNFDILPIGLYFGETGTPRNGATNDWYGQPAADWAGVQDNGINLKHVDCDGSGLVDFADVDAINLNYNRTHDGIQATNFGMNAEIYLDFAVDTIVFNPGMAAAILITADVMMGTDVMPAEDVYGFAFTLNYPSALVEMNSVEMVYDNMSWFGDGSQTIDFAKDLFNEGQFDLAFTRVNQSEVSGFGKIATVSFVVTDNITGKMETDIPFTITASDVKVINGQGDILPYSAVGGTVHIIVEETTTDIPTLEEMGINVFPNPTSTVLNIELTEVHEQQVTLYNALGQMVYTKAQTEPMLEIPVEQLASGIYLLNIETEDATHTLKVMIE